MGWGNRRNIGQDIKDSGAARVKAEALAAEKGVTMIVVRETMVRWDKSDNRFGQYVVMPESEKPEGAYASSVIRPRPAVAAQ